MSGSDLCRQRLRVGGCVARSRWIPHAVDFDPDVAHYGCLFGLRVSMTTRFIYIFCVSLLALVVGGCNTFTDLGGIELEDVFESEDGDTISEVPSDGDTDVSTDTDTDTDDIVDVSDADTADMPVDTAVDTDLADGSDGIACPLC